MMRLAEENGAKLYFNEKCTDINFEKSKGFFKNTINNEHQVFQIF